MIKKVLKIIIPVVMICIATFILAACKDNEEQPTPDPSGSDAVFYDLSELNYSEDYFNPDAPDEKGFIVVDALDFNTIKFNIDYTEDPTFYVYYGDMEESLAKIEKEEDGYPKYVFEYPGGYSLLMVVPQETGLASARVAINVRMCGVPERIDFVLRDANGKVVRDVFAGNTYTITAAIQSDGEIIDESDQRYVLNWDGEPQGITLDIAPMESGRTTLTFYYSFTRSGGQKYSGNMEYTLTVFPEQ